MASKVTCQNPSEKLTPDQFAHKGNSEPQAGQKRPRGRPRKVVNQDEEEKAAVVNKQRRLSDESQVARPSVAASKVEKGHQSLAAEK